MASTGSARAFQADPYDYGEVRRLAAELKLAEPVAVTLVRRGYRTVDAARRFLEARESHEPSEFRGMEEVCEQILAVARGQGRITIHGDYDVDGVTSTAILVSTLRSLGAECDWLIPDRLSDGYGLTMASVEQLQRRGTELVITVDCGIGSVEEVAAARAAGHPGRGHRPSPARRAAPRLPGHPPGRLRLPVRGTLRRRRGPQARHRPLRRGGARRGRDRERATPPAPTATSTWSRSPPSPTWSRWWGRTAASSARASAFSATAPEPACAP